MYAEGMTQQEVADDMRLSIGTVNNVVSEKSASAQKAENQQDKAKLNKSAAGLRLRLTRLPRLIPNLPNKSLPRRYRLIRR